MLKEFSAMLHAKEFTSCREEIEKENRQAIRLLAVAGLPLSVANIFAQTFFSRRELLSPRTLCFALLLLITQLLPKQPRKSTLLVYLAEAPVMIIAILLGTVWDPTHQALTFLLFLMAMPVFILDHPVRLLGVTGGWCTLFLGICLAVKDPGTHRGDFFHTLEFFLAASAVTLVVLRVRLNALRNLERARYHMEHDALTATRNRFSLSRRTQDYLGKPLVLIFGDLDELTLFNDFYGQDVGDQMLICFAQTLQELFGEEHTYRYGGDELLCVAQGLSEQEALERMAQCRERLRKRDFGGNVITLTCSFGYAYAVLTSAKDLQEAIQLADIYTHNAKRCGQGYTVGGPYDEAHLRAAITERVIAARAREAEENQLSGLLSVSAFASAAKGVAESVNFSRAPLIGFLHIIHFRNFNEEFGYAKGDALISHTAKLLQQGFPGRCVCNVTGSQFGVLCYQDEVESGVNAVNEGLKGYCKDFPIVIKCGFAPFREGEDVMSMLDKAKAAHDAIYSHPSESV